MQLVGHVLLNTRDWYSVSALGLGDQADIVGGRGKCLLSLGMLFLGVCL